MVSMFPLISAAVGFPAVAGTAPAAARPFFRDSPDVGSLSGPPSVQIVPVVRIGELVGLQRPEYTLPGRQRPGTTGAGLCGSGRCRRMLQNTEPRLHRLLSSEGLRLRDGERLDRLHEAADLASDAGVRGAAPRR